MKLSQLKVDLDRIPRNFIRISRCFGSSYIMRSVCSIDVKLWWQRSRAQYNSVDFENFEHLLVSRRSLPIVNGNVPTKAIRKKTKNAGATELVQNWLGLGGRHHNGILLGSRHGSTHIDLLGHMPWRRKTLCTPLSRNCK